MGGSCRGGDKVIEGTGGENKRDVYALHAAAVHIFNLIVQVGQGRIMQPNSRRESHRVEPRDISKSKHFG